ncbi:hypothetical protein [Salinispira pacifica]|uniref:NGG1p interacting factor NIF3 n=1 Tax=Salinispira pacifica TaxID=1307761 RepID=V5WIC5_9SPIO|nr:hypothetical protein [Salinispira pacifica]AHC15319.1 hypothetical protein L21SP2_1948 [Salinispira pacifica]
MLLIYFFVPKPWKEAVKEAMFAAGAGRQGEYSMACWETAGRGQFLPGEGAQPAIGRRFSLRRVREFRVEMICEEKHAARAVQALRRTHPYEEPAFGIIRLEDPATQFPLTKSHGADPHSTDAAEQPSMKESPAERSS